jgi:hypothetical protein
MPKWYDFARTLTLYHGTSSSRLPDIRRHGIRPLDVAALTLQLLKEAGVPPSMAHRHIFSEHDLFRQSTLSFFTVNFVVASQYAKMGGEAEYCIRQDIKVFHKVEIQRGINEPIVLELELPWSFISFSDDMVEMYNQIVKYSKSKEDQIEWLDNVGVEFTSARPVPAKYIVEVHKV